MREHLLGYLLDALEPDERQRVEDALERDPSLRRELQALDDGLVLLRQAERSIDLPAGLAERTCRTVTEQAASHAARGAPATTAPKRGRPAVVAGEAGSHVRQRTLPDVLVAAGVVLAATLVVFPAIQQSRVSARLAGCQNNLRKIGLALAQYCQHNHDHLPSIPPGSTAGIYAVRLKDGGYLDGEGWNLCPGAVRSGQRGRGYVPTWDEFHAARGPVLAQFQRSMGGSYGFTLHYVKDGVYRCVKNRRRPTFAIMSDTPCAQPEGLRSANHGGRGQNVLYEDGHVQYLTGCTAKGCRDHIFLNDQKVAAAGCHVDDAVIGESSAWPLPQLVSPRQ
jgi:hypothetical protein